VILELDVDGQVVVPCHLYHLLLEPKTTVMLELDRRAIPHTVRWEASPR
jgi:hypothetical protein